MKIKYMIIKDDRKIKNTSFVNLKVGDFFEYETDDGVGGIRYELALKTSDKNCLVFTHSNSYSMVWLDNNKAIKKVNVSLTIID